MAIKWTEYANNSDGSRPIEREWTSHEGLVVSESWTREERVMSDVYANVTYVNVWNPNTEDVERINLGEHFELGFKFGTSTLDASSEILDEVARREVEAKRLVDEEREGRRIADSRKRVEDLFNVPVRGKVMEVVRGRKVSTGTVGTVFWIGDGRVGLALSDAKDASGRNKDVAWVNSEYLANTDPAGPDYSAVR
jgi:hypothetical protein